MDNCPVNLQLLTAALETNSAPHLRSNCHVHAAGLLVCASVCSGLRKSTPSALFSVECDLICSQHHDFQFVASWEYSSCHTYQFYFNLSTSCLHSTTVLPYTHDYHSVQLRFKSKLQDSMIMSMNFTSPYLQRFSAALQTHFWACLPFPSRN